MHSPLCYYQFTICRANDLQEHLIQRKFRELGLGNGTPPLHNIDAGLGKLN